VGSREPGTSDPTDPSDRARLSRCPRCTLSTLSSDELEEAAAALRAHGRAMGAVYVLIAATLASGVGMAVTVVLGGSYVARWLVGLGAVGTACGVVALVIALRARRLRQRLE